MERIRFEGEGRQFSMTPEEQEAHKKAEVRRRIMTQNKVKTPEVKSKEENKKAQLTKEEQKLLEEIVPDAETRANLAPEAIRVLIDAKKEEREEKK